MADRTSHPPALNVVIMATMISDCYETVNCHSESQTKNKSAHQESRIECLTLNTTDVKLVGSFKAPLSLRVGLMGVVKKRTTTSIGLPIIPRLFSYVAKFCDDYSDGYSKK